MSAELYDRIFKAYDIRGLVEEELTVEFAFQLGCAYANFLEEEREPGQVVVGEDMRPSSPDFAEAFSDGVTSRGLDVIRIGLASTDMLYFASGSLNLPGIMFTASHNPATYNGMKLCKSGARPIGKESGLLRIRELMTGEMAMPIRPVGKISHQHLLDDYVSFLLSLFGEKLLDGRHLKIAIDAGNGMAGFTAPAVMKRLNVSVDELYFELDGNFPNHEANPIEAENLVDLQKAVRRGKADIGLAFDGDADRCFLVDERGDLVKPSTLTALIAERELKKHPGGVVIYNLISSHSVPEVIKENGGVALRSKVGHSYIKREMANSNAIFAGEHSGHFYFRDFWFADSGMLAALYALSALAEQDKPLSHILSAYDRYANSGEINSKVQNAQHSLALITEKYSADCMIDTLDGVTVTSDDWWFNARASNTEPLLRLNVEASDLATMKRIRDEVLALINS